MDFIINFLGANPYQAIAVPVFGGFASGFFGIPRNAIQTWYPALKKPAYNPPHWAFGPVWASLYAAMGYSSHLVACVARETLSEPKHLVARSALGIYAAHLGVNFLWTPLFFRARNPEISLLDIGALCGLVGVMTYLFAEVDGTAGWICVPYLCWVGFASYLNYYIVKLNPGNAEDKTK